MQPFQHICRSHPASMAGRQGKHSHAFRDIFLHPLGKLRSGFAVFFNTVSQSLFGTGGAMSCRYLGTFAHMHTHAPTRPIAPPGEVPSAGAARSGMWETARLAAWLAHRVGLSLLSGEGHPHRHERSAYRPSRYDQRRAPLGPFPIGVCPHPSPGRVPWVARRLPRRLRLCAREW